MILSYPMWEHKLWQLKSQNYRTLIFLVKYFVKFLKIRWSVCKNWSTVSWKKFICFSETSESLTKPILGIMVKCLNGRLKFLLKMILVAKSEAIFYMKKISYIADVIKQLNGQVIPTDTIFFKNLTLFIISLGQLNYVHLFKSIWNNWITEAFSELLFYYGSKMEIVKGLFKHEKIQFFKQSKLMWQFTQNLLSNKKYFVIKL